MNAIQQRGGKAVIAVRVTPRASKNEVIGFFGDAVKIKLTAPPVEGKANRALVEFLSDRLDIPVRRIELLAGETGRNKRVSVGGLSADEVCRRLMPGSAGF